MGRREHDERLVRDWHAYAYRYALFLTGNTDRAADLTQDALLRALVRRPADLADEAFGSWLRTVMVRMSIDGHRRVMREVAAVARLDRLRSREVEPGPQEPSALTQALTRLSAKQRACVVLRYLEDLSEGEVARIMDMRLGTVKAHLARARAGLRRQLEGLEPADLFEAGYRNPIQASPTSL
jgi:RNA polymerase sigma factor (sigma-70 family)